MVLSFSFSAVAQRDTITLKNPSFEDSPRQGSNVIVGIKGWFDCGIINFPKESPPDIHPKDFWENTKQPDHGKTYLGMVVRDNDSYEAVSQKLTTAMEADNCYSFSVRLSRSERYISGSTLNKDSKKKYNYTTPAVLRIWGGSGYCDEKELLGESRIVNHSEWKTYSFKLSPSLNHKSIMLEAYYKVPVVIPYNGHILLDNCSQMVKIDCQEEILAVAEEKPNQSVPFHKKFKKRKPKKEDKKVTTVAQTQPSSKKKILDLDRSKMTKGQTIEIKNLYFSADVATINKESYNVLDEVYDFLKANQDITVEIGGHTNGTPTHEYCDKLSTERAKEVAVYLVNQGIDGDRIFYKGYGKRKAKASNFTPEGRKKNQRVEIKILSIG